MDALTQVGDAGFATLFAGLGLALLELARWWVKTRDGDDKTRSDLREELRKDVSSCRDALAAAHAEADAAREKAKQYFVENLALREQLSALQAAHAGRTEPQP